MTPSTPSPTAASKPTTSQADLILLADSKLIALELETMGWAFCQVSPTDGEWLKFNRERQRVARCGDETWDEDNTVAAARVAAMRSRRN